MGRSTAVQYNGSVEASKQGYSKCKFGPYITVQYNGSVVAYMQGYSKGSLGAVQRSKIMAQ
jgi:hypothetical protein